MTADAGTSALYAAVRSVAAAQPDSVALLRPDGSELSYAGLIIAADQLAAGLRARGVAPGGVVTCSLSNGFDYVAFILAIAKTGAVYCPILQSFDDEQVLRVWGDTQPVLHVVDGTRPSLTQRLAKRGDGVPAEAAMAGLAARQAGGAAQAGQADREPRAPARRAGLFRMLWSSGSTGLPKTIVWRQENLLTERRRWIAELGLRSSDVVFCRHTLDVAHATDLHMFAALLSGAQLFLADPAASSAELLGQLAATGATVMSALPSHYDGLAQAARAAAAAGAPRPDVSRLRLPLCGGAYLSAETIRDCQAELGFRICEIYGSTEFGLAMGTGRESAAGLRGLGVIPGVGARVEPLAPDTPDIGELVLCSPCTSEGYLGNEDATGRLLHDGEFWTGDVATRYPDGSFNVLGRLWEVLQAADGPLLAPVLDEVLMEYDGIAACATIVKHPGAYRNGAIVVLSQADGYSADDITASIDQLLTRRGIAGEIHLTDVLPRTDVGKVDKAALRRRYLQNAM